jgi:threonine synthase
MWKAFGELKELGWWRGTMPRLVAVQSEGCAPVVTAWRAGATVTAPFPDPATRAAGLRVPAPLGGELMLHAIRATQGCACAVSEAEILHWTRAGSRQSGVLLCPEGGAVLAALVCLRRDGFLRAGERVVAFNTATGLKYPEVLAAL